jgi:uncharacterized protein (TIGR02246 family)
MWQSALPCLLFLPLAAVADGTPAADGSVRAINAVLDDWHQAAAAADEGRYFGHFTADAVFLGTDATERWTLEEFRQFAKPHFARKKAWSFKPTRRHVRVAADGNVAWFDEELDTPNLGPSRGSGVLVRDGDLWRIAHYNLTVPIPNKIMSEVKKMIEVALKEPEKKP